jgi:hypothetical protein
VSIINVTYGLFECPDCEWEFTAYIPPPGDWVCCPECTWDAVKSRPPNLSPGHESYPEPPSCGFVARSFAIRRGMGTIWDIDQLFTVGIGFDLAGAYLLARGLFASPRDIARRTGSYYGYNAAATTSEVADKVAASTGLASLGVGFTLQAVGYVAKLDHSFANNRSATKAVVGFVGAILAIVLVVLVWRLTRDAVARRLLVEVARYPLDQDERLGLPLGQRLEVFAETIGQPRRDGEDNAGYLRRVFGVEDAFYGERPFWRLSEGER